MNRYVTLVVVLSSSPVYAFLNPVPTVEWTRQIGPIKENPGVSLSIDTQGAAYLAATTPNHEAIVTKYDTVGDITWSLIGGTLTNGEVRSVSVDPVGNVFTGGWTGGAEFSWDAFVTKYSQEGSFQWTRQITAAGRVSNLHTSAVSADPFGNVYISGRAEGGIGEDFDTTLGSWVKKYDADGNELWTQELATDDDVSGAIVTADPFGNVYMTGRTHRSLGEPHEGGLDTFLAKYDGGGNHLWTRQLGTDDSEASNSVATDALGNVFIAGWTDGELGGANQGSYDLFVSKYDAEGNFHWTRQLGTSRYETAESVAADGLGNVYVSGFTEGNLGPGDLSASDLLLAKYDTDGSLLWSPQLYGTDEEDEGGRVVMDGRGNIFIAGFTEGSLGGPSSGDWNAFLIKLNDPSAIPEPSTGMLLLMTAAVIGSGRRTFSST